MPRLNADSRRLADELRDRIPPAHARRFTIVPDESYIRLEFDDGVEVPEIKGPISLWDLTESIGLRFTGGNFESRTVILEPV